MFFWDIFDMFLDFMFTIRGIYVKTNKIKATATMESHKNRKEAKRLTR